MKTLLLLSLCIFFPLVGIAQTPAIEPKFKEIKKDEFPAPEFRSGSSWGDYDNDGWQDLFINGDSSASDWLIQNGPSGILVAKKPLSDLPNFSQSGAWGDYNNDGWPDLFVAVGREGASSNDEKNDRLYKNVEGNLTLMDSGPIVTDAVNSTMGVWSDINNDGLLDLLVSTEQGLVQFTNNDGNTFTKHQVPFEVYSPATLSMSDLDQDGDSDLIAFDFSFANPLIIKLNNGQFLSESINDEIFGATVLIEDFDNDGHLELITQQYTGMDIYDYDVNGKSFASEHIESNAGSDGRYFIAAGDLDNNGYVDLIGRSSRYYPIFYMNQQSTVDPKKPSFIRFQDTDILGLANARSIAIADYNNDGWLDLFTMNESGISPIAHHLFEAVAGTNHWLRVKLKGVVSNRDGIGAKVKLQYGQGTQLREIRSNSSSLSGNELIAHFGLGQETVVTSLTIEWPSGAKQLINEPGIDQLHIVEEENNITAVEENSNTNAVYPNPANSIIHIVSKFPMNAIKLTTAQGTEFINMGDLNTDSYELPTIGLPEGLYVLEIISKKGKEIKKVVVKR